MGVEGQSSHFLDPSFSPVTHLLLAIKAVLDKFSSTEVQRSLNLIAQLPLKKSCLFLGFIDLATALHCLWAPWAPASV